MVMFLALHPMELIFLNSPDLLEHLAMLQTCNYTPNKLLNKAIGMIIKFAKLFLNFITDTSTMI